MRFLFVHQNFPGQYQHVVRELARSPANQIVFITQQSNDGLQIQGVRKVVYKPARPANPASHPFIRRTEDGIWNATAVAQAAQRLRAGGFRPDVMIGHTGWGETLYLKDVWPDVPLLAYLEFFFRASGADTGFDPEFPMTRHEAASVRTNNALHLMGFEAADWGQTPTRWQKSVHPAEFHGRLSVIHEGVDTAAVSPRADAALKLSTGLTVTRADEIVTYISRSLEPYRGFHTFMRSLPLILARRPRAQVIVVGNDGVSYGRRLPGGQTWREKMLRELHGRLDLSRVHFLGNVPYGVFLSILRVSAAHVYLSYPFVLSWSMIEAMSAGCVVIGSATPPVQEVIRPGENGLLVDFFSPWQVADAVDQVLDDPSRMQDVRDRARSTAVESYDFRSQCLPAYGRLIRGLAAGSLPDRTPWWPAGERDRRSLFEPESVPVP
jgi:glycosyltransferase involved in cell wall biosynthesis